MSTKANARNATETKPVSKRHLIPLWALMILGAAALIVSPAAAAEGDTIDWSSLSSLIEGAGTIMPSIGSLIFAIVPIIFALIVVGFITGLFDSLIGAVRDCMRFFGR